jgi:hypothetical protein
VLPDVECEHRDLKKKSSKQTEHTTGPRFAGVRYSGTVPGLIPNGWSSSSDEEDSELDESSPVLRGLLTRPPFECLPPSPSCFLRYCFFRRALALALRLFSFLSSSESVLESSQTSKDYATTIHLSIGAPSELELDESDSTFFLEMRLVEVSSSLERRGFLSFLSCSSESYWDFFLSFFSMSSYTLSIDFFWRSC